MSSQDLHGSESPNYSTPESTNERAPFLSKTGHSTRDDNSFELGNETTFNGNRSHLDDLENPSTEPLTFSHGVEYHHDFPIYPNAKWTRRRRLFGTWLPCFDINKGSTGAIRHSQRDPIEIETRARFRIIFKAFVRPLAYSFMLLGIVQFILLAFGFFAAFFPEEIDWSLEEWNDQRRNGENWNTWPTDFTAGIPPIACHSHNDYWRKVPLFSAIKAGCTSVEADVFLFDNELYVGHTTSSLTSSRTLQSLYIDPLLQILAQQNPITKFHSQLDAPRNGVFDRKPSQTLVLLIDFKLDGELTWPVVHSQLEPLRQKRYLTHFDGSKIIDGPITVVVTGNAPFDRVVANTTYRDMFFDAPLELMAGLSDDASPHPDIEHQNKGQGHSGSAPLNASIYTPTNSYYASVDFQRSILQSKIPIPIPGRVHLTRSKLELLRAQIVGAHAQGLKVRYWNIPDWPRGWRNYFWRLLSREGVDYLNVNDLKSASTGLWRKGPSSKKAHGVKKHWERAESAWWYWT